MSKSIPTQALSGLQVKDSAEATAETIWWVIYGTFKHGKTVTAATISDYSPDSIPPKEMTNLPDILYWQFDHGGMNSLKPLNLRAPFFDLSMYSSGELKGKINEAFGETQKRVASGETTKLIIDNASTLDVSWQVALSSQYEGPQLWGHVLGRWRWFMSKIRTLPCDVVILAHAKAEFEIESKKPEVKEQQKAQKAVKQLPGGGRISMEISGRSYNYISGQGDVIAALEAAEEVGSGKLVRKLYTQNTKKKDFSTGQRFGDYLDPVEIPHLRKLTEKIRGAK